MNVNEIVEKALAPMNMVVKPNYYSGNDEEYITFNYSDERPVLHADDEDIYDSTSIQVHLFTKQNSQQYKKTIRRLMKASGFSIISTSEFYETDTEYSHIVVECFIEGIIDD